MNDSIPVDPVALARACAAVMYAQDQAVKTLDASIVDIGPGTATLTMTLRQDMLNCYGSGHGGFLFALADAAFAYACNSRNEATVAAGCSIEYLRPVPGGTLLTATAIERALVGRSGVYDVTVCDAEGNTVALFRGKSARIKGELLLG